jgi:superfamily II DNA/RNA helicase
VHQRRRQQQQPLLSPTACQAGGSSSTLEIGRPYASKATPIKPAASFEELPLPAPLLEALKAAGLTTPTDIQVRASSEGAAGAGSRRAAQQQVACTRFTAGPAAAAWRVFGCSHLALPFTPLMQTQSMAIPAILGGGDLLLAAQTGSGKTLAYLLPMVAAFKAAEGEPGMERRARRPKMLVLAPTKELSDQVCVGV